MIKLLFILTFLVNQAYNQDTAVPAGTYRPVVDDEDVYPRAYAPATLPSCSFPILRSRPTLMTVFRSEGETGNLIGIFWEWGRDRRYAKYPTETRAGVTGSFVGHREGFYVGIFLDEDPEVSYRYRLAWTYARFDRTGRPVCDDSAWIYADLD